MPASFNDSDTSALEETIKNLFDEEDLENFKKAMRELRNSIESTSNINNAMNFLFILSGVGANFTVECNNKPNFDAINIDPLIIDMIKNSDKKIDNFTMNELPNAFLNFIKIIKSTADEGTRSFKNLLKSNLNKFFLKGCIIFITHPKVLVRPKMNENESKTNDLPFNHQNYQFIKNNINLNINPRITKTTIATNIANQKKGLIEEQHFNKIKWAMVAAIAAVKKGNAYAIKKDYLITIFEDFNKTNNNEEKHLLAIKFITTAQAHRMIKPPIPNFFTHASYNTKSYEAFKLNVGAEIIEKLNPPNEGQNQFSQGIIL